MFCVIYHFRLWRKKKKKPFSHTHTKNAVRCTLAQTAFRSVAFGPRSWWSAHALYLHRIFPWAEPAFLRIQSTFVATSRPARRIDWCPSIIHILLSLPSYKCDLWAHRGYTPCVRRVPSGWVFEIFRNRLRFIAAFFGTQGKFVSFIITIIISSRAISVPNLPIYALNMRVREQLRIDNGSQIRVRAVLFIISVLNDYSESFEYSRPSSNRTRTRTHESLFFSQRLY